MDQITIYATFMCPEYGIYHTRLPNRERTFVSKEISNFLSMDTKDDVRDSSNSAHPSLSIPYVLERVGICISTTLLLCQVQPKLFSWKQQWWQLRAYRNLAREIRRLFLCKMWFSTGQKISHWCCTLVMLLFTGLTLQSMYKKSSSYISFILITSILNWSFTSNLFLYSIRLSNLAVEYGKDISGITGIFTCINYWKYVRLDNGNWSKAHSMDTFSS